MRTLHIHDFVGHMHWPHWRQMQPRIKDIVTQPIFWAIVVMALLIGLLILLALFSDTEGVPGYPNYPGPIYPFTYPYTH